MHFPAALKYLDHYPEELLEKVRDMIEGERLQAVLRKKYPAVHDIRSNRALYDYVTDLKNEYLKTAGKIAKIQWDDRLTTLENCLGRHRFISRVQGSRLRASNEILIASVFRTAPLEFLRVIAVHELAHLKEKEHNRAFYNLCEHMEPDFHQLEFDMRLFLTCKDLFGSPYEAKSV